MICDTYRVYNKLFYRRKFKFSELHGHVACYLLSLILKNNLSIPPNSSPEYIIRSLDKLIYRTALKEFNYDLFVDKSLLQYFSALNKDNPEHIASILHSCLYGKGDATILLALIQATVMDLYQKFSKMHQKNALTTFEGYLWHTLIERSETT